MGTIMALLLLSSTGAALHGERVFVAWYGCTRHAVRPTSITLACGDGNLYADHLQYTRYGGKTAPARAMLHLNDCTPYCARGHFHSYRGTLILADVARCGDGRLYYTRARYRFSGRGPSGISSSGTAFIEPTGHCGAVLG